MELVTVGVDIGQKHDPTAVVVCEGLRRETGRKLTQRGPVYGDGSFTQGREAETEVAFEARHLERLPLGTDYPAVAERVAAITRGVLDVGAARGRPHGVRVWLVVDATGVGAPVVDILRRAVKELPAKLTAATFTHGDRLEGRVGSREARVGKAYLVSRLQALVQTDRLALPPGHPEAAALARELLDYEIRVDEDANDRYGAFKVGTHDDLVTALGLAVLTDPRPPAQAGTVRWA